MDTIRLTPLPTNRALEDSGALKMEREGFVDEAVVLALVNSPRHFRSNAYPADLALAADDLDFAGWQLPTPPSFRGPEIPPQVISAIVRRASPPTLADDQIGPAHRDTHRWWMAGVVGILATMLLAILLLTLLSRMHHGPESLTPPPTPSEWGPASQRNLPTVGVTSTPTEISYQSQ
jgi:hypothetical protein